MVNTTFLVDSPSPTDEFNRKNFASTLADSLTLPKNCPGLVVGIEGGWGSGKSTLISFIKTALNKHKNVPIIVEFNPWMTSGSEAVVEILLLQLASVISAFPSSADNNKGLKVGKKIVHYVGLLKHLKHFRYLKYVPGLSVLGLAAEDIANAGDAISDTAAIAHSSGQNAIDDIEKLLPNLNLLQLKEGVIDELNTLDKPIVVIIDDIDRLTHSEIRILFQAIKAVADFPRVTYLLSYDHDLVSSALNADFKNDKGSSYLEKIVQVAYPLPLIMPWQMHAYIDKRLKNVLSRLDIKVKTYEEELWPHMLVHVMAICSQPRDVLRLLNKLLISLTSTRGEINICDVIVIEVISMKYPFIRQAIQFYPEDFTGEIWNQRFEHEVDWMELYGLRDNENKENWLNHLPKNKLENKILQRACKFIFPKHLNSSNSSSFQDSLRICITNRLQRYFALTSIEGVIDAGVVHDLLVNTELLESIFDTQDLSVILYWINIYIGSAPKIKFLEVLKILNNKSCNLLQDSNTRSLSDSFSVVCSHLLDKMTNNRKESLIFIIDNFPLSISHDIILDFAQDHNLWNLRRDPDRFPDRWVDDIEFCKLLITKWCEKVLLELKLVHFYNEPKLSSIIYRLDQLSDNRHSVISYIKQICNDPVGIEVFLENFIHEDGVPNLSYFDLIWNPTELATLIEGNPKNKSKYEKYIGQCRSKEVQDLFKE